MSYCVVDEYHENGNPKKESCFNRFGLLNYFQGNSEMKKEITFWDNNNIRKELEYKDTHVTINLLSYNNKEEYLGNLHITYSTPELLAYNNDDYRCNFESDYIDGFDVDSILNQDRVYDFISYYSYPVDLFIDWKYDENKKKWFISYLNNEGLGIDSYDSILETCYKKIEDFNELILND